MESEFEKIKMHNYILKKENELILGTIKLMAIDKEKLLDENKKLHSENEQLKNQLNNIENSKSYRIVKKIKSIGR